jgi:hypothetical protein
MRYLSRILGISMACWFYAMPALAAAPDKNREPAKTIPSLAEVKQTVVQHFAKNPDYRSGDLITQDEVEPLLQQLQEQGLPLVDAKNILAQTPSPDEFLVQQLRTPSGQRFMRRIAKYPDGYDRLDRLSRMSQGHQTLRVLINNPQGDKLIEYMTSTQGGKKMGRMLSHDPGGANFNAATGRLYTVPLLLDRLKQSHAAAVKAAEKNGKRSGATTK